MKRTEQLQQQAAALTRRDFLQRTAASAVALSSARTSAAALALAPPLVPAIDTHTHFYDPARPQGVPWPKPSETQLYRTYLPPEFQTLTATHKVVGTVVVEASPWVEDNQWVLDLAQEHPIIVGFVGNLTLGQPEFAAQLKRFSRNPLFRGLRLGERALAAGISDTAFKNDLRRLADQRLTLDVLGGEALLPLVVQIAKLAPRLRVVIDHLPFGNWDNDAASARRALTEIARLPNVYAKVSGVARQSAGRPITDPAYYRAGLDVLWELFGPRRLLYGSNWPVSERVAPYATVHTIVHEYFADKGSFAAAQFFWKNSHNAYHWLPRGAAAQLKP